MADIILEALPYFRWVQHLNLEPDQGKKDKLIGHEIRLLHLSEKNPHIKKRLALLLPEELLA